MAIGQRKILALVVVVLTIFSIRADAQSTNDREKAELIGTVKGVRERSYRYYGEKDENGGSRAETGDTVSYDRSGNEIERDMVSDFGESMGKAVNTYDETGLLKSSKIVDVKGKIKESSTYLYSGSKLTQTLRFDGTGVLREKTVYTLDGSGRVIEEVYSDPKVARAKTVFRYDGTNIHPVEMSFFMSDGTRAYASVGPCLGAHRVTYSYDAKNRPVEKSVFEPDGKLKKSWVYAYNDRSLISRVDIKSTSSTTSYSYKYEFDGSGNWIKRVFVNESPSDSLELLMKATGKEVSADELKRMKDEMKISSVTLRDITYF